MKKDINIQTQHQIVAQSAIKDWLSQLLIPVPSALTSYSYLENCSWDIKQAIQHSTEIIYIDSRWARHQE